MNHPYTRMWVHFFMFLWAWRGVDVWQAVFKPRVVVIQKVPHVVQQKIIVKVE